MSNNSTVITKMVNKLMKYKESYYNGNPIISDEEFDFEEQKLKDLDPGNDYFLKVGSKIKDEPENELIPHKFPMLSMQKVKTVEEANKWFFDLINNDKLKFEDPVNLRFFYEPKLDGISGSVTYDKNGEIKDISTRGDGLVGQRIIGGKLINSIPKNYIPKHELRGEFCIKKSNRQFFNGPLRNICAGILKKKTNYEDQIQYVDFIIYDSLDENGNFIKFENRKDKLSIIEEELKEYGNTDYNIVPVNSDLNIRKVYDLYINKLRNDWDYETDGLVLTIDGGKNNYDIINSNYTISNHNKFNMALKPPAKYSKTKIIGFNVEISKSGKLAPVAIVEPIIIDSVKIEKATLYNFEYIKKNDVGIGSTVLLQRSNDVIPKIEEVYNIPEDNVKVFTLNKCPCCKTQLIKVGKDLLCPNFNGCRDIYKSKLSNLLRVCNIKNIGPSIISNIVKSFDKRDIPYYISSFIEFLLSDSMKIEILDELYNSGSLKFNNIKRELDSVIDNMTELDLIVSFCIPLVGHKLLIKNKILSCDDLMKYLNVLKESNIENSAFDGTLLTYFNNKKNEADFSKSYKLMKKHFKQIDIPKGLKFCISGEILGLKKSDVIKEIESSGNQYVKDVTMNIDFLISDEENTLKIIKAKKYNIKVLKYIEFKKQFC